MNCSVLTRKCSRDIRRSKLSVFPTSSLSVFTSPGIVFSFGTCHVSSGIAILVPCLGMYGVVVSFYHTMATYDCAYCGDTLSGLISVASPHPIYNSTCLVDCTCMA